jgi:hypothetical protein
MKIFHIIILSLCLLFILNDIIGLDGKRLHLNYILRRFQIEKQLKTQLEMLEKVIKYLNLKQKVNKKIFSKVIHPYMTLHINHEIRTISVNNYHTIIQLTKTEAKRKMVLITSIQKDKANNI